MLDLILLVLVIFFLYWRYTIRLPANFPPGPRALTLPVIGDALSMSDKWFASNDINSGLQYLRKKYGDVYGCYLGPARSVVVSDYQILVEIFGKEEFSGRPFTKDLAHLIRGGVSIEDQFPGVIGGSGRSWHEQRRFSLQTLRDLGFGKKGMEGLIEEEVETVMKSLELQGSKPINLSQKFNIAVIGALWQILASEKLEHDDPKLVKIIDLIKGFQKQSEGIIATLAFFIPNMLVIADRLKIIEFFDLTKNLFDMMNKNIEAHDSTYQEDYMRDFTDAYLKKMKENDNDPSSSFFRDIGKLNLSNVQLDLFFAGSDTTSTTLYWGALFMILYPEVQKKVQDELDAVTGGHRYPQLSDQQRTPYTEAVIHEIQRISCIVPIGVFHEAMTDTKIGKYDVPRGTVICSNLYWMMHDPMYFPDPEKFMPERHIINGKFKINPRVGAIFGIGRRRCLGESLAKLELYKFFTGLLHKFTIKKESDSVVLSTKPKGGQIAMPQPFNVILEPRN